MFNFYAFMYGTSKDMKFINYMGYKLCSVQHLCTHKITSMVFQVSKLNVLLNIYTLPKCIYYSPG